ncbi:spectrin beta chain, non-erythrocytic 5 kst [Dermatophagoides pteronyssinus]|uniref:spectrin beta chain, non-erythrocytic 5 kst n=1 Tax=Dermatophagoides pteronyssinus TaxID=6956 RepID=UPI003F674BB3
MENHKKSYSSHDESAYIFEKKRIVQLHEERIKVQKKTFTKWMNSFIQKAKLEVDDIFVDLADGKKLLKLLEIISGEKLGKPNNGKLRVQKIENVNKCLAFLHTKVKLESIGAEDIVDGNKTLILGLLWTIILRFQIQDIEIQLEENTDKKHSAKEALLLWCQRKTNGYPNAKVTDFTQSWRNGMAFNALIHSHRPELINYEQLDPKNSIENLNNAFKIAQENLAIQPLLDPEDVDTEKPDEKSILTYVSSYYHTFAKYNSELISGKRITNIISQLMEIDRLQLNYELLTTNLLNWIQMKIHQLDKRESFANLDQIQNEFARFKDYRTVEKPPKYRERSEIEALLFNIQTKRKALGQVLYLPPEGKLIQDIHKSWVDLEKAEHRHELKLREEMRRLEQINNMADSFYRKCNIRKSYLDEMIQVLSDVRYGNNLSQVEATIKKHEAISADILSRKERIDSLQQMTVELKNENYFFIDKVENFFQEIKISWDKLISILEMHQKNLSTASNFMRTKSEIETIVNEFLDLIKRINIDSNVTHLRTAEEYLQTHTLLEAQIASNDETVKRLTNNANKLLEQEQIQQSLLLQKEIPNLQESLHSLQKLHETLKQQSLIKRKKLIKLRDFYRLLQDIEEEETTLADKLNICQAILPGKDLLGVISLQQKHNVFEAEIKAHDGRIKIIEKKAQIFMENDSMEKKIIEDKLEALYEIWKRLQEISATKSKELAIIIEAFQYYSDANETESWLKEKIHLAKSEDYGNDEQTAQALLKRHNFLESEIMSYSNEVERLNIQSEKMINSDVESLFVLGAQQFSFDNNSIDNEQSTIDEINDETETTEISEKIPQVYVIYDYATENFHVKKGDILILIAKTTPDWWKVCFEGMTDQFYVPSNYVKEIEPKIVNRKQMEKPLQQQRKLSSIVKRRHSKRRLSIVYGADTVEQRRLLINTNYKRLIDLCKIRRKSLEESIKMFCFNSECDSFENWLNDMENTIEKSMNVKKEQHQQQENSKTQSNDLSKQFEKMITDLLANRSRLDEINRMSNEMNSPMYMSIMKKRKEQIQKKWDQVNFLQKQLGKNIEGLTSVEVFDSACTETLERINDKLEKINDYYYLDVGQDLKTAQALQRKHENLELELIPITDSLKKLNIISENVKSSYPLEKSRVDKRLAELKQLWEQLKKCSDEKRSWLDKMIGLQIIKNSSNDINAWLNGYAKQLLQYDQMDPSFKNVESLETITKEHNDLLVDIKGKHNDIEDLKNLAEKLKNQIDPNELKIVDEISEKYEQIYQEWIEKTNFLRQCSELNCFNQEADRIETIIGSDLTFLEFDDIGNSCQDIYALIKRHERFLDTLNAQDQRIYNFIDFGDKLIQNNNFEIDLIKERQKKIIERRKMLKDKAFLRQKLLNDARMYHEIKNDAEEFLNWCQNKQKNVKDLFDGKEIIKNDADIERKMKKHQTLAAEIRAHRIQMEKILNNLDDLNKNSHLISTNELDEIEQKVKNEWIDLNNVIENNEKLMCQISRKMERKKSFQTMQNRFDEIQSGINLDELPIDRRTCKKLLQKNKLIEKELSTLENKVNNMKTDKQSIDDDDQTDGETDNHNQQYSDENDGDYNELKTTIIKLKDPLNKRNQQLLQLNEYFQFEYDANAELQWIKDRIIIVSSNDVPQNLTDAQNWLKKLEQNLKNEINTHENHVMKILDQAKEFIQQNHLESDKINKISEDLNTNWNQLIQLTENRIEKLKIYLKIRQFLSDCNEIELWLNDKMNILNNPIYGNDEITLIKLLQKQKSMDLEIDAYSGLIDELVRQSEDLSLSVKNEPEQKLLKQRAQDLNVQLKKIQKLSNERNLKLIDLKQFYEYYQESNDFLEWLKKKQQILLNEDYGKDYEHCIILQAKFFDLKRLILANEELYKQCMENSKRFIVRNSESDQSTTTTIDNNNSETIETIWQDLMNLLQTKEQKFIAAVKIHRFNRDVADAYERIHEKYSFINNQDYGRDCQTTQNLIRNHDVFENDLVALEAQLQILINDSVKLKQAYPGGNAKQIGEKLKSVLDYWEKLKDLSTFRRQKLCDTYEFYQFVSIVRNLEQWSTNLINEMKIDDEQIKNELNKNSFIFPVDKAQNAKNVHERIKSEIDSRENEFNILVKDANKLVKNPFYNQIKEQTEKLLKIRDQLYNIWQIKDVTLDQLVDYCIFIRDLKQLEQLCQQFKNRLETFETEQEQQTAEEVNRNLKKFNEFIKLFESHEQKFNGLKECATKLLEKNNNHSDQIQICLEDLLTKKTKLWQIILSKKDQLSDDLIYAQFQRDIIETDSWIDEKRIQIEQISLRDKHNDDIEIKLKKLQKQQALEAEINVNTERITAIQNKAKHLITKNHHHSIQIRSQLDDILKKWEELKLLSRNICEGFEEAKDIYEFNKNVDLVESWIREKELMIQFNDTGEDFEHCQALLKKLDDVGTGLKVDEDEIHQINHLADKLLNQCKNENQIDEKRLSLNEKWKQLQEKIANYRQRLINALEIHSLNRDLDEINERVMEKHLLASKECDAKDLSLAENEQRKHVSLCYDIYGIENHFKNINDNDVRRLIGRNPELMEKSRTKIQTIQENLRKLSQECSNKDEKLQFAIKLNKFFDSIKEYENWANNILAEKLSKTFTSENISQAEIELQDHEYIKDELISRKQNNKNLKEYGLSLLQELKQNENENQLQIQKVQECIDKNDELQRKLDQAWDDKCNYLKQCKQLHKFNDLYKQSDSWLTLKEAFLTNEDLGSNLIAVEDLLKKHDSFVQSFAGQQRIIELSTFAQELIEQKHFDLHNIQMKNGEILERRDKLFELAKIRKNKLENSKLYFKFLQSYNEIYGWLVEKIKVANDESYRESINLLSKKQKHAAFEAEINSNKERIDELLNEGDSLINNLHFRSEEIKINLDNIKKLNRQLNESTAFKRNRLNEAYQALQFFRLCDVLSSWIKDIEAILNDKDNGKDLSSVRNLLKKHELLENDVHNHNENVENIKDQLAHFQQNNHFQIDEIEEKGNQVIKRFNDIQKPIDRRREILEDYHKFFQFKNDVEHEFFWIKEKENQLNQFDNTNSVLDIQRLIKRHKMLESEIQTREIQLSALVSKGHSLLKAEGSNLEDIKFLTNELQKKIQYLKDAFALKRMHLIDSLESHQFYSDVVEAESWINEKNSFLLNDDNGRDEESVSMLLKRLEAISNESERFNSNSMAKLIQQSNQLIDKNHSESNEIKQKLDGLVEKFNQFSEEIKKKRQTLSQRSLYYSFEREADELISWIKDQQIIANSEDYGQDVEHIESLIQQFNTFISFIMSNEERVKILEKQAENVQNSEEKLKEIQSSWNQLKKMAAHRQELLQSAEEVHRFCRSADETVSWIREKESSTIFDEVNSKFDDINTIKAKIHKLEGFEHDLNAVREQVETLYVEADKLIDSFDNVKDQIEERKNEVKEVWDDLNMKTKLHKANLIQIENSQSYFDQCMELLTWINEMQALITADDKLVSDVMAAEQQLSRHQEYETEIKLKNKNVEEILATGKRIISEGHIMSKEIEQRNERMKNAYDNLVLTWQKRLTLYEYNVDARHFVRDVEQMEKWINANHNYIDDNNFGDSISDVEELLIKHEEFEKTITTQLEKLNKIERITLMEKYFENLKREEEEQKAAELLRQEKEKRMEEEQKRILFRRSDEESKYYENNANKSKLMSSKQSSSSSTKTPRRYASFSFVKKYPKIKPLTPNLPQFSCKGMLERKHLFESGGKKAESRTWKTYYTVLCGHLLCFFKDKNAFNKNSAASAPLSILNAKCEKIEYKQKKHVFSIEMTNMCKYLFITSDEDRLREWISAITFRASLPPSDQLIDYKNFVPSQQSSTDLIGSSQNGGANNVSDSSSSSHKSSLTSLPDIHSTNHENSPQSLNQQQIDNKSNNNEQNNETNSSDDKSYFPSPETSRPKINKYGSLPANMMPIKEDSIYAKNDHPIGLPTMKSFDQDDIGSLNNEKTKKKRRSFFKRSR